MKFLGDREPQYDLAYDDVCLVPRRSDVDSRLEVDLTPPEGSGLRFPVVAANMNALSGRRMAETLARRGGAAVLSQDVPLEVMARNIARIKAAHPVFDTPITFSLDTAIGQADDLLLNRAHGIGIVVDGERRPIGVYAEADGRGEERNSKIGRVMTSGVIDLEDSLSPREMLVVLTEQRVNAAPVVDADNRLAGIMTQAGAVRTSLYEPALDGGGKLLVAAAVGINGDPAGKAEALASYGADILVIDTAHGHQEKMLAAIKAVRRVLPQIIIVAGNVVTSEAVNDLLAAGADIAKVGVGPGAMCTTRMATGVGRPQFSAVMDTAQAAVEMGGHVWADGGIRYPRDIALALAAGASSVMAGSMLMPTHESSADMHLDPDGRFYKKNFGMASGRAVTDRAASEDEFDRRRRAMFVEGISESRLHIDPKKPGVEDILDEINAGLRSSMTYAGARNIKEFNDRAVVSIQTTSGFTEGTPRPTN